MTSKILQTDGAARRRNRTRYRPLLGAVRLTIGFVLCLKIGLHGFSMHPKYEIRGRNSILVRLSVKNAPPPMDRGASFDAPGDPFGVSWAPAGPLWAVLGSPGAFWLSFGGPNYEIDQHSITFCRFGTHKRIHRICPIGCHHPRLGTSLPRAPGVRMT